MATFIVTCPVCEKKDPKNADVELNHQDIQVALLGRFGGLYSFKCPNHKATVLKQTDLKRIDILLAYDARRVPLESFEVLTDVILKIDDLTSFRESLDELSEIVDDLIDQEIARFVSGLS